MKFQLNMTAQDYEEKDGYIVTKLAFGGAARRKQVEVESKNGFAEADAAIQAFGNLHAPCNVWVGCASPRKPAGFDKWAHRDRLFPHKPDPTFSLDA